VSDDVTVVVTTIPPRQHLLRRALDSVHAQTHWPAAVHVEVDLRKDGAGPTRNRGLASVATEWVAFLDDDDELYPQHLERCLAHARETSSGLVYPWFDVVGGNDPFPAFFGHAFDPNLPNMFPVTVLARTDALQAVLRDGGGFAPPGSAQGDDWPFWLQLVAAGVPISHLAERTWRWHHHRRNTSGRPDRW
jgi:glycosyltransferase involved in cell wall biosynthesis